MNVLKRILKFFKAKPLWQYGTCIITHYEEFNNHETAVSRPVPARKHRIRGNVQFVLWKAGEQGHAEDYWHDFNSYWWPTFKPEIKQKDEAC
jgi:hypothetical protein